MIDQPLIEEPYEFQKLLGFTMVSWTAEKVVLHVSLLPKLTNRYGVPHGGVYASLLDAAMGYSGCYTGDPEYRVLGMTLNLNVSYLSRPKGNLLITEGWKIGGGKRNFFAEGRIIDETGELIATGAGTFRYRNQS